jgi:hypothetical protein
MHNWWSVICAQTPLCNVRVCGRKGFAAVHSSCTLRCPRGPCSYRLRVAYNGQLTTLLPACNFSSPREVFGLPSYLKMTVFWDAAPCSLVEVNSSFRGAYWPHHRPDVGGSKNLWNVGHFLPDCTVQHPRRQSSSCSSPWDRDCTALYRRRFSLVFTAQFIRRPSSELPRLPPTRCGRQYPDRGRMLTH